MTMSECVLCVFFHLHIYSGGTPTAKKIGFLQSKRLYPENHDVDADDPVAFAYGLNGLLEPLETTAPHYRRTTFKFIEQSIYGAIRHGDEQLKRISEFHDKFGESVFYLLYHPPELPFECTLPAINYHSAAASSIGTASGTVRRHRRHS